MADVEKYSLWENRPPKLDHLTYLTYIAQEINKDRLPALQAVLETDRDTTNAIGWDLVSILLPLLPDAEGCLLQVAQYGQEKEVLLSTSNWLESFTWDAESTIDGFDSDAEFLSDDDVGDPIPLDDQLPVIDTNENDKMPLPGPLPLPALQFQTVIHMLAVLHRRLDIEYPSRFYATSLRTVIKAYHQLQDHHDDLTIDVVNFLKTLVRPKRPPLPGRRTSSSLSLAIAKLSTDGSSDKAEEPEPVKVEAPNDAAIQLQLLKAFLTHLLEAYIDSMSPVDQVDGLAWSARYQQLHHPSVFHGDNVVAARFENSNQLEGRLTTVGQIVALAQDLGLEVDHLFSSFFLTHKTPPPSEQKEDKSYPTSAADIPLSGLGSFYLFTARRAAELLHDAPKTSSWFKLFGAHASIVHNFCTKSTPQTISYEQPALLDALLLHGLASLDKGLVGKPKSDDEALSYLADLSAFASTSPSPSLRSHAAYLIEQLLSSHISPPLRLKFIQNTLDQDELPNLYPLAVSWVKRLTLDAEKVPSRDNLGREIFATPAPLYVLSPLLFPDITQRFTLARIKGKESEYFEDFLLLHSFYSASLNFLKLLLSSPGLRELVDVKSLWNEGKLESRFVSRLRVLAQHFIDELQQSGSLEDRFRRDGAPGNLCSIIVFCCEDIAEAQKALGW